MVAATPNPWPIAPIAQSDLDFAVVNYDFATFTDNEQSELPSLEGALDISLLDYAASIADQTTEIASLFDGIDDVFAVLDEIGNDDLESIFTPLANASGQGDAVLATYNSLIGDNSGGGNPAPAPPTQASCLVVAIGKQPEYTGGVFTKFGFPVTLANQSGSTITIQSATWNPDFPNIYKVLTDIVGKQLAPGDQITFEIQVTTAGDGEVDSTLTIQTDGPDPQPCVTVTMEIDPNPSSPTSGPGGPQSIAANAILKVR